MVFVNMEPANELGPASLPRKASDPGPESGPRPAIQLGPASDPWLSTVPDPAVQPGLTSDPGLTSEPKPATQLGPATEPRPATQLRPATRPWAASDPGPATQPKPIVWPWPASDPGPHASGRRPVIQTVTAFEPKTLSELGLVSEPEPTSDPGPASEPGPTSEPGLASQLDTALEAATTRFSRISERIRSELIRIGLELDKIRCSSCISEELPEIFTDEEIEEYMELTYLTREEILRAYTHFCSMGPQFFQGIKNPFLPCAKVFEMPEFKVNPFKERMVDCFSSYSDFLTFEDYLEMMSVFSENAPVELKAEYAFKLYDFDLDDMISIDDLVGLIKVLKGNRQMDDSEMKEAAARALIDGDVDEDGYLAFTEFAHLVSRLSDFKSSFTIRL